jgi:hypothetical protein
MITVILWLGTTCGLVTGLIHATQIVATGSIGPSPESRFVLFYRAAWAIGLWTLFGSYLLILWFLAVILRMVFAKITD